MKVKGSTRLSNNHGYDDERGEYKLIVGDHIGCDRALPVSVGSATPIALPPHPAGTALRCKPF